MKHIVKITLSAFVLAFIFANIARADIKAGNEFMADYKAVFGDERCEKAVKRHALNCPTNKKEKETKCEKWEKERKECVEKNKNKNKGI